MAKWCLDGGGVIAQASTVSMLTSYFQLRSWYCVGCKRARGGCEKDMLSCQSAFLRFRFPSQLEPSKPMRQVRKYRHGMGNQPSTPAEL